MKEFTKEKSAEIYFKYPSLRELKKMTPQKRLAYIENKLQRNYKTLETYLEGQPFELIGTKKKPRGVKIKADKKKIDALLKLNFVDKTRSMITADAKRTAFEEPYYCFKVIFQIQLEGQTSGLQSYDERYILVKAASWEKAELKVIKECRKKEEPYLNPYGKFVRWRFESIEESYHTFIESKNDFDHPVEVFSKLKKRKLQRKNIWQGD